MDVGAAKAPPKPLDWRIVARHRVNETSKRLDMLQGMGPRWRPPWWRASPIQRLSDRGGTSRPGLDWCRSSKDNFGSIGKQGDRYLSSLFTAGALVVIR